MKFGLLDEVRGIWHSASWSETIWRTLRIALLLLTFPLFLLVLFSEWLEKGPKNHWKP